MNIWLHGSITMIRIWILDSNTDVDDGFHSNILIFITHLFNIDYFMEQFSFSKSFSILSCLFCCFCFILLGFVCFDKVVEDGNGNFVTGSYSIIWWFEFCRLIFICSYLIFMYFILTWFYLWIVWMANFLQCVGNGI